MTYLWQYTVIWLQLGLLVTVHSQCLLMKVLSLYWCYCIEQKHAWQQSTFCVPPLVSTVNMMGSWGKQTSDVSLTDQWYTVDKDAILIDQWCTTNRPRCMKKPKIHCHETKNALLTLRPMIHCQQIKDALVTDWRWPLTDNLPHEPIMIGASCTCLQTRVANACSNHMHTVYVQYTLDMPNTIK